MPWRATEVLRIRFAQASEPCKKRGKVGSVKQRLLAELNAFEVTSFDRCVERSATDTEQVKCLPDPVSCLRKTENTGVNRIVTRVLVGTSSWHGSIRQNCLRVVCEGAPWPHCAIHAGSNEQPESAQHYAVSPFRDRDAGLFQEVVWVSGWARPLPDPKRRSGTSERSVGGIIHVAPFHRWSCWSTARSCVTQDDALYV